MAKSDTSDPESVEPAAPNGMSPEQLDKLGRERPPAFKTWWAEWAFCASILGSMLMAEFFISGFVLVLPAVTRALDMPPGTQTWPASVFAIVSGSLLFPFGRVADMYGGRLVYICGLLWYAVWCLVAGFSPNHQVLIVARAMQGFGPAAFLPSGVMLLGSNYRPGPRKNMVFSLYGSCAPVGFFIGILAGGATAEYMTWSWYFWLGSIVLFIIGVASIFGIPVETSRPKDAQDVRMDWWGLVTTVPGLLLVIFAITQGAHAPQGFATPYVYVTLVVGLLLLGAAVYVEGWVAEQPLIPYDLFAPKYMTAMVIGLFNIYGAFGVFQFYASFYIQNILGHGPLLAALWFSPLCAGGFVLAIIGGVVLHKLPNHALLVISGLGSVVSTILFVFIPADSDLNYWAWVFPAMLGATVGVDIAYNVSSVFMTTSLPSHRQGLAGALINTLIFLGVGLYLGVADLIVQTTAPAQQHDGSPAAVDPASAREGQIAGFRNAFWLAFACSASALLILGLFARIGRAKSDLTFDEKQQLQAEALCVQAAPPAAEAKGTSSGASSS
ncbi:hypothetical protein RB594_008542 [Gaeumannomyces avenae]